MKVTLIFWLSLKPKLIRVFLALSLWLTITPPPGLFLSNLKFDRNRSGEGVIVHVPSKQLTKHKLPDDIEGVFIEVNLRKTKWLIFGAYWPLSHPVDYFFKHLGYDWDIYRRTWTFFLLVILTIRRQSLVSLNFYLAMTPKVKLEIKHTIKILKS